ncbi:p53 apoptosis effector related to PMP-22-like [Clytia hemisphaerica]|uniref:Cnidarian restricted protein n=1 Tax=Clytia hemisphaerica TaxID=252671 RepID=A0A7M5WVQ4_9CNID
MVEAKKVGVLIACVAVFILLSASTGGSGWMTSGTGGGKLNYGLFSLCGTNSCASYGSVLYPENKWRATQGFMVLSVLVSLGAAICGIILMISDKVQAKIIAILLMIAFVLSTIGLAIFTDIKEENYKNLDYGWAYGFGWVGALAALGVGVAVFLTNRS